MHEVGLMQDTIEIVLDHAERAQATEVVVVRMRVGDIAGVDPEALQFAFHVVTKDTIAAAARLDIERIPVRCYCAECRREFEPPSLIYCCPRCGKIESTVLSGREFEIVSIVVN